MLLAAIQQLQQALTANGMTINPVSWTINQNLHGVSVHFDWLDPLTGLFSVNIAGIDHGESNILNKINYVKKSPSRQKRDRKRWNNHMMKIKNQVAEEPLSTKLEDKADKEKNTQEHSAVLYTISNKSKSSKIMKIPLGQYHANCITQCFNWGDHFPPHVCYEVSDMHLHILAINTT